MSEMKKKEKSNEKTDVREPLYIMTCQFRYLQYFDIS